jgi:alkylation response protein AidB-like acyl-CoA dehydrogenase
MDGSTGFNINTRDIAFVLFEQLKVQDALDDIERYEDFDVETYQTIIDQALKLSQEVMWPANVAGDREHGCKFHGDGKVTTPSSYPAAWEAMAEGGFVGFTAHWDHGGANLPEPVAMAVGELLTGAAPALSTYAGLSRGVANVINHFGSEEMKELHLEKMNTGEWGGTMCLTEADAGSSVGDNRTKATPTDEEGVFLLEGEKIFITGGDQDLTENIIHLVLARLPGAPNGTKGLSIFLVPKFDYASGERNDAYVVGIEHKMGLLGSATCVLALGAKTGNCRGYMLGEPGQGMKIMFQMMNEARVAVGIQGLASAAAAYNNALAYAKERVQGTSIKDFKNPDAKRVPIVVHPDVRRMLMDMKVLVETMRSMCYTTALRLVQAENTEDEREHKRLMSLVELMTPICKSYCSDKGYEVATTAMQVFGGYGYINEYPVEQHVRDVKIASIYEGTNGIQAMDLVGRKMRAQGGMVFMSWMTEAKGDIAKAKSCGAFDDACDAVDKGVGFLAAAAMHLGKLGMEGNLEGAMLQAMPFLNLFGCVVLGVHALEQAAVAHEALEAGGLTEKDQAFYKGKILNAEWYAANHIPAAIAASKSIQASNEAAMDESLFA